MSKQYKYCVDLELIFQCCLICHEDVARGFDLIERETDTDVWHLCCQADWAYDIQVVKLDNPSVSVSVSDFS